MVDLKHHLAPENRPVQMLVDQAALSEPTALGWMIIQTIKRAEGRPIHITVAKDA